MEHTSKAPALFPCPCCGLPTLDERPPGTFLVCPTCWWEDDRIQFERPDLALGANRVNLDDAKQNYGELGISDPALRRYQRNAQAIRFSYRLMGSWAVVNLADERRGYKMVPTYLSDALGDLVGAVNRLFDLGRAKCSWADEPGEWLWSLEHQNNRLRIEILRFREWHLGKTLDPQSQTWNRDFAGVVYETECDLLTFAAEIERALQDVLSERTLAQYEMEWHHAFPQTGIEQLRSHIEKQKI